MYLYVFTHLVIHINVSIQGGNKGGRGGNGSSRGEEEAIYMTYDLVVFLWVTLSSFASENINMTGVIFPGVFLCVCVG